MKLFNVPPKLFNVPPGGAGQIYSLEDVCLSFERDTPHAVPIYDIWFGLKGETKWIAQSWRLHIVEWAKGPTHFHMTLEDYLAALLGEPAGGRNFFELLPCEMKKKPEIEFAEFFNLAGGSK